ncbi:hypothetical protein [Burkholderia multivorans]|uniref:hypothetical protein n=1 Tax=Burkholderia multivorans TaxID=87883 RepID=UPI00158C0A11|nr:hypothetical protein [Burkholderia multivorans]MDN7950419.1 hypothetical protein [Burkholderia multivorans]MDR9238358.1 hypothetical protein [Burkholderia multivorans]MDR9270948.1 hypothetical protein [Burkholderia multivorans]MDR9288450.1 hypothetical protein [Burkholderia multivorans]MDR9293068.1 hypothetical protein [Burkholderia multivorans]
MRNANLDMISSKATQLAAMVGVGHPNAEISTEELGNYAWLMGDLPDEIKCGIDAVSGVSA